jgi:hypothetical protein
LQKSPIGQSQLFSQNSLARGVERPTQWPIHSPWTNLAWQRMLLGQSWLSSQASCRGAAEEAIGNSGITTSARAAKASNRNDSIRDDSVRRV